MQIFILIFHCWASLLAAVIAMCDLFVLEYLSETEKETLQLKTTSQKKS